jgi:hypothetical protein
MKHAAPGMAPRGSILEHESSDVELGVLRATSVVSEDIREVLGLSTVTNIVYSGCHLHPDSSQEKLDGCEKWFELVRSASEKPVRSKYFLGSSSPSSNYQT